MIADSNTALGGSGGDIVFGSGNGVLKYGSNLSAATDFSPRFTSQANQIFAIDTNGKNITFSSDFGSAGSSLVKLGEGSLTLNSSVANDLPGGVTFAGGELIVDSSKEVLGSSGVLSFTGGTLRYGPNNSSADFSDRFNTAPSQLYRINTGGKNITFASPLSSSNGSLTKLGAGQLTLTSAANSYGGDTVVEAGTLRVDGQLDDATDLTVNSGATYIANSNDVIGSIFGAGSIDIGLNTLDIKGGIFPGILQSDSLGSFVKSRNISLTLLGNNSSFLGSTLVESGEVILSNESALGVGGGSIQVDDGASLILQSSATTPGGFQLDKSVRLGTSTSSAGAAVFELASGSAQLMKPLYVKGEALVRVSSNQAELLLSDTSGSPGQGGAAIQTKARLLCVAVVLLINAGRARGCWAVCNDQNLPRWDGSAQYCWQIG